MEIKYVIQSNGVICSIKGKKICLLKQTRLPTGYLQVSIMNNGKCESKLVHRLVAQSFLSNENNKPCVNHKDGNKENNNITNLEWCTYSENEKHSYVVLGKINPIRKLNNNQVEFVRLNAILGRKGNIKEMSIKYNVDIIINVCNKI